MATVRLTHLEIAKVERVIADQCDGDTLEPGQATLKDGCSVETIWAACRNFAPDIKLNHIKDRLARSQIRPAQPPHIETEIERVVHRLDEVLLSYTVRIVALETKVEALENAQAGKLL